MFQLMFLTLSLLLFFGTYRFARRTLRFYGVPVNTWPRRLLLAAGGLALIVFCGLAWRFGLMGILHLLILDLLLALLVTIVGWVRGERPGWLTGLRDSGLAVLALTLAVMAFGWYNFQHPVATEYLIGTSKISEPYTIVLITDTHYCGLQNPETLSKAAAEIGALEPDLVVLGGDIVEESSSRAQMEEVFRVLGGIRTTYGVYYVYGNHDRQTYTNQPSYTPEELAEAAARSGVTVLADEYRQITDDLILAGREDAIVRYYSGRMPTGDILAGADRSDFIIVADHQPVHAEENAAQGVDLQLSGHTHAGQIWPLGLLLTRMGQPLNYGEYQVNGCTVIVSSGFAGWGFPLRTQERSEYAVIRVEPVPAAS